MKINNKYVLAFFAFTFSVFTAAAQNVGINTATPKVILDINSTEAVQLPAGTTAQRPPNANVSAGAIRFNVSLNALEYYDGSAWVSIITTTAPSGSIMAFGGTTAPAGWLLCDGTSYTVATYPNLYAAIGDAWGGDGGTNFNVPDLRGRFLRGVDGAAGIDPDKATRTASAAGGNTGNNVGSVQGSANAAHSHGVNDAGHVHSVDPPSHTHGVTDAGHVHSVDPPSHSHGVTDAGHVHSVDPPSHTHGITDAGHVHSVDPPNTAAAVTDPGHNHGTSLNGQLIAQSPGACATGGFDGGGLYGPCTGYGGVSVNNNTTGISAAVNIAAFNSASATTGVTVNAFDQAAFNSASATTGVTVNAFDQGAFNSASATTGVTVNAFDQGAFNSASTTTGITINSAGSSTETRPTNANVTYIIKY